MTAALAPAPASQQTPTLIPFRYGTRRRFRQVNSVAYAPSATLPPMRLDQVGMLAGILIRFVGSVTFSAAGALSDLGPWNLLNRIRVTANLGLAQIIDLSGYGAYMMQRSTYRQGYAPDAEGVRTSSPDPNLFSAPVAIGANAWQLTWFLPFPLNYGDKLEFGLISLQAPQIQVNVELVTGALTDPGALITATSGTFFVDYLFYEIPDVSKFTLPPLALCRWIEDTTPIIADPTRYQVPRQGMLRTLYHLVRLNNARSDAYQQLELLFNKGDSVERRSLQAIKFFQRAEFLEQQPTGVIALNFDQAGSALYNDGDPRDWIDTEELTTIESILTLGAGPPANSELRSIRNTAQILRPRA